MATFGWSDEDRPVVGDAESAALAVADSLTDDLVRPAYSVLDASGAAALATGIERIGARVAPRLPGR
jgi:hypothetical protein